MKKGMWTKDYIFAVFVLLCVHTGPYLLLSVITVYGKLLSGSDTMAGMMASVFALSGLFARFLSAWLLDKFPLKKVLIGFSAVMAAASFIYIFSNSFMSAFILRGVQGLAYGASTYFCCSVLPDLFHAFRKKYPYITVHLEENNSTPQLKEHLQSREIDFALSSNTYPPEDYDSFVLDSEAIILAVPCTDTINETLQDMYYTYDEMTKLIEKEEWTSLALKKVSAVLFKDQKFITIDKNSDLYPRILRMFKEYDETPEIIMHLQQMSSCYYMAAGGFGSAFLRSSTLRTVKDTGNLYFYLIDSPLSIRQTRFYYKKGGYVSKAMQAFMDFTREASPHEKSY